jgi:hypothetical protein
LRALAEDPGLLNARNAGQPIAYPLGLADQQPPWQIGGGQGIEGEIDIREVVVDKGPPHPGWQLAGLVQHALADFVEEARDPLGRGVVLEFHQDIQPARAQGGLELVKILHLAEALLQGIGDQVLHLLGAGSGPEGGDHQDAHRKGRVLGPPQLQEGQETGQGREEDEEEGDRALPYRQGREIEAQGGGGPGGGLARDLFWVLAHGARTRTA